MRGDRPQRRPRPRPRRPRRGGRPHRARRGPQHQRPPLLHRRQQARRPRLVSRRPLERRPRRHRRLVPRHAPLRMSQRMLLAAHAFSQRMPFAAHAFSQRMLLAAQVPHLMRLPRCLWPRSYPSRSAVLSLANSAVQVPRHAPRPLVRLGLRPPTPPPPPPQGTMIAHPRRAPAPRLRAPRRFGHPLPLPLRLRVHLRQSGFAGGGRGGCGRRSGTGCDSDIPSHVYRALAAGPPPRRLRAGPGSAVAARERLVSPASS
jgi:hypothetical protein